jgi:hypothetical protein
MTMHQVVLERKPCPQDRDGGEQPTDLGVQRRLHNLAGLVDKAKGANRRLLELQRAGQGCAIETARWERISQPSREEGQRTGALRFRDQPAMARGGALCVVLNTVVGFPNKSLRALVYQLARRFLLHLTNDL